MSLGTVFDRILSDVQAKIAANADARGLALSLASDLYYLPDAQFNRFLMLYLRSGLEQLRYPRDAAQVALYVRRIVAAAVASPLDAMLIEAKYLARFS